MNPRNLLEIDALQAASGPTHKATPAEAETYRYLAALGATTDHINRLNDEQRYERSTAVLRGIVSPADAEAVRAAFWVRTPVAARMVALMAAKLPKERASRPLADLDAFERGRVHVALDDLIAHLQNLQKCMNGGKMPTAPGIYPADHVDHRADAQPAAPVCAH